MRRKLILVDGLVAAGRSQIASEIASKFHKDEVNLYQCLEAVTAPIYIQMMQPVLDNEKHVIIERTWRNDDVSGLIGQGSKIDPIFKRMLTRVALGCSAHIAQCAAAPQIFRDQLGDDYDKLRPTLEKLQACWRDLPGSGLRVHSIDFDSGGLWRYDIDLLMDRLSPHLNISNDGPGIGSWRPGEVVLVVGDRHGPSIQPYQVNHNLAFCDMAKAGSSYWLTKLIIAAGISEDKLYWINAFDKNAAPTDHEFIKRLRPITVLTLGDSAERWAQARSVRYERFSHPQWHKRFHYAEEYPAILRLKEIFSA